MTSHDTAPRSLFSFVQTPTAVASRSKLCNSWPPESIRTWVRPNDARTHGGASNLPGAAAQRVGALSARSQREVASKNPTLQNHPPGSTA